ncbi:MAG: hypothetical protein ACR2G5_11615, partial [Pyrinomonadaceae bacterium]
MRIRKNQPNRPYLNLVLLLQLLVIGALSCRNRPPVAQEGGGDGDRAVAAQKIAEADKLYGQRDDLSKVRQGVALLRQARTADYGSYEAAWKAAKYNYYLGAHTEDERELDAALREGIDIGKIAMQR